MKKMTLLFKENKTGEIIKFTRYKNEWRELTDLFVLPTRLYPCYKITNIQTLIKELKELNYNLATIIY